MNESISAPFIRYPIATSLLMAGILFVGLVSYPLLPVAPLPQVDFPTIQVSGSLPGASPETMASSVAQPLERQLAQIPGIAQMTSTSSLGSTAITIQFELNRSIDGAANDIQGAINAASGQLPKNLPTPPTYRKVNPADSPVLLLSASIGYPAADDGERRGGRPARTADQPDFRRRAGVHRRPAEARDPGPDRPREAGCQGPVAGRHPQPDRDHHGRQSEGQHRRRQARLHHLCQRPAARSRCLERRHRRLSQWRSAADPRYRPRGFRAGRHEAGRLGRRQARGVPGDLQAARRQCHRYRRPDQGATAAADCGDSAGGQDQDHQRPHPHHPFRGRGRAVHAPGHHHAGGHGDFHLPAQRLGDHHSERHGSAGAARRLFADVGVRIYPRQSVADGADDRRRTSWSTTPS